MKTLDQILNDNASSFDCQLESVGNDFYIIFPDGWYILYYKDRKFGRQFTPDGIYNEQKVHSLTAISVEVERGGAYISSSSPKKNESV